MIQCIKNCVCRFKFLQVIIDKADFEIRCTRVVTRVRCLYIVHLVCLGISHGHAQVEACAVNTDCIH